MTSAELTIAEVAERTCPVLPAPRAVGQAASLRALLER